MFGKPRKEQLAAAEAVVSDHFADKIAGGVFDDWASQIGRTFSRPLAMLPAPLALKRRRYPQQRYDVLLALRTRDRGGVVNLLAFALAIDALITPTIPQPVRNDYMIALLGQWFMRREVIAARSIATAAAARSPASSAAPERARGVDADRGGGGANHYAGGG